MARAPKRDIKNNEGKADRAAALLNARYPRLELALIDAATAVLTGGGLPEGAPVVSAETAVKLLTLRTAATGRRQCGDALPQLDPADLRQKLAGRLSAVRHVTALPAPSSSGTPTDPSA